VIKVKEHRLGERRRRRRKGACFFPMFFFLSYLDCDVLHVKKKNGIEEIIWENNLIVTCERSRPLFPLLVPFPPSFPSFSTNII